MQVNNIDIHSIYVYVLLGCTLVQLMCGCWGPVEKPGNSCDFFFHTVKDQKAKQRPDLRQICRCYEVTSIDPQSTESLEISDFILKSCAELVTCVYVLEFSNGALDDGLRPWKSGPSSPRFVHIPKVSFEPPSSFWFPSGTKRPFGTLKLGRECPRFSITKTTTED